MSKATTKSPIPNPKSSSSNHVSLQDLKSSILSSLSKLSDRDTHSLALDHLDHSIRSLPSSSLLSILLPALLHDPSPAPLLDPSKTPSYLSTARRESLRLLSLLASLHSDALSPHLPKLLSHLLRRLKDPSSDSSVRDAVRDVGATLSALYLRPIAAASSTDAAGSPLVGLFVKPWLEAMGEQNKVVQGGAAMCLAKVVESAGGGGDGEEKKKSSGAGVMFQKLVGRVCKMLAGGSFLAKASLLGVVSSLAQVGAISRQSMPQVMQTVRECLDNSDWATRKAAADTLSALANHCSDLVADGAPATISALESCRFDKVKPVRDSMMEALSLWKKISGKGDDGTQPEPKDTKSTEAPDDDEKVDNKKSNSTRKFDFTKNQPAVSSPPDVDSVSKGKGTNISEKAAVLLKKRAPSLSDKDLNPEFFQKLEARIKNDMAVEVVVPRRCLQSSQLQCEEQEQGRSVSREQASRDHTSAQELDKSQGTSNSGLNNAEKQTGEDNKLPDSDENARERWTEQRGLRFKELKARGFDVDDPSQVSQKDGSPGRLNMLRADGHSEGSFTNSKASLSAIQRQLMQLERQQASLMNMLQDFMGGSHDSMITLENRVRGLERVVEEMARDLSISSGRRGGNMMLGFDRSPGRSSKYNGLHEYSSSKFGRSGEGRHPFSERFLSSDGMMSGVRGRDPPRRSDSEQWDSFGFGASRNGIMNSRRGFSAVSGDSRTPRSEHDGDQVSSRRAWDKAQGPFRLGEGPSARSVWQASKDEATLEAIRVAGDDNGTPRGGARVAIPELDAEALTEDNPGPERGPLWASWTRAMDALQVNDYDSAYVEVLATCDDSLLVKLMDKSGPVFDQLSAETATEILRAIGQFLLEQSLLDIALSWIQQLAELVVEYGPDFLGIPLDWKREILFNLHEASTLEMPEDWDGVPPDQLLLHLASAWGVNVQQLMK